MNPFYLLELAGITVFAISGALAALERREHHHDFFSVFFTGFITAIGGGTLRDITLGNYPVSWVRDQNVLWAIFVGFMLTIGIPRLLLKLRKEVFLFDTVGIGIYTILGTKISLAQNVNPFAAIILGMVSAIFGGVIRDTLMNQVPFIFRKEIYATACLLGAFVYISLRAWGISEGMNAFVSVSLVVLVRIAAVKFKLSLPKIYLPKV
ncbi:putative membrane protein [Leptospira ryugenii]|uniref:Putative membrane protein n=1 Tax=Leptospira ryugenii TaxID=1917863 RepID=A0A2P2DZE4_9LEPT|nr:trimeric intracellular cation channel family protein [Leptospira ryugenii]GBF49993.1 putative membrane protein [Leptospira ryugenii]